MHAVLLPVGADLYALPVDWVREVVAAPEVTALVTAPPFVLGLFNLRGDIVPLLDTATLLGIGRISKFSFAVVIPAPQGICALAATREVKQARLGTAIGPSDLPGTAGCYRVGPDVAVLLDPAVLLAGADTRDSPLPAGSH